MMRSPRPLLAGLVVAAGLAIGSPAGPVAAHTGSLFPAGVMVVPVVGVAGVVPPIVVPPMGIGTPHRANVNKAWSSTEPADITIGGQ
jgi:hypothetical protein